MIVIVKYNGGNIASVENAVNKLGYECKVSDDLKTIQNASKIIFPGVGEASSAMKYLSEKGMDVVLKNYKKPMLGICLGLQLMCETSEEGNTVCLKIFNTKVKRFPENEIVPHMGWNSIEILNSTLLGNLKSKTDFYYVHSYFAEICDETTAISFYNQPFSAVLEKDNFYATQFHPEKSADLGYQILKNFLEL
ncbi:imidazole glycerol phosphate synthase subunit HisH [Aureivirga sp. CE67]|uniref:imidazole glycerol phosphate synthase subunit HisH n=1 Tax=Aureivirga sp. CE67 TaxID=1788983 RepID=UPI0018C9D98B|nr:imidazole glycerol phosphate synthase subunit HisH [Aureivirga sp. CE67]